MNMELSRRAFMRGTGAGLAGTAIGAFGFGDIEKAHADSIRAYKLLGTTETRQTCTYCSVACGVIMYSLGDKSKNAHAAVVHIEGDRIIRPIAARSAPRARRCSTSSMPRPAPSSRNIAAPANGSSAASAGARRSIESPG